jgi:hypothetical protein
MNIFLLSIVIIGFIQQNESKLICPNNKVCSLNMKSGVHRWLANKILTAATTQMIEKEYYEDIRILSITSAQFSSLNNGYAFNIKAKVKLCNVCTISQNVKVCNVCSTVIYNFQIIETQQGRKNLVFFGP